MKARSKQILSLVGGLSCISAFAACTGNLSSGEEVIFEPTRRQTASLEVAVDAAAGEYYLTASGFAANADIALRCEDPAGNEVSEQITSDSSGGFSYTGALTGPTQGKNSYQCAAKFRKYYGYVSFKCKECASAEPDQGVIAPDQGVPPEPDTGVVPPDSAVAECTGSWGACSATCGGGTQTYRIPKSGSGPCPYADGDTQACNSDPCPVDCQGSWDACSASCDGGTQTFTVTTPAQNGGAACAFADGDTRACNTSPCAQPIDCVGSWGACSASCGGGTQTFNVTTPAQNGGQDCANSDGDTRSCNTQACAPTYVDLSGCTGCHGAPPSSGRHSRHSSYACSNCHNSLSGSSKTTMTWADSSLHMNGTVNTGNKITSMSGSTCTNSCHGSRSW